eukprot:TRINITY_DN12414_c0_g1_i1.p1 TRINITY_DN12414_c0_g1~~TRINITY_DN12414_c0_g1_i1.p1  ORF type:complete len:142 (-),score=9.88 TRINITY_DN12414_c0_g1_i1:223-648(-)
MPKRTRTIRALKEFYLRRVSAGIFGSLYRIPVRGIGLISREVSNRRIFDMGAEGNCKFSPSDYEQIQIILWSTLQISPTRSLHELKLILRRHDYLISETSIRKIFKAWRWSFKKPAYKQVYNWLRCMGHDCIGLDKAQVHG